MNHLSTHNRAYSDDERILFAQYREQRAALKPKECIGMGQCWVRLGPPCYLRVMGTLGDCAGCGGRIKTRDAYPRIAEAAE